MRRGGGPPHAIHPPTVGSAGPVPFPQCAADVLQRMAKGMRQSSGKFRGQSQHAEWQQLIDNELFCLTLDQFHISKLTPIQRLQLLEVLARFFNDKAEDPLRYTFFEVIFLAHEGEPLFHDQRMDLLYNFASYTLQCPVVFFFTTISQWLSKPCTQRVYAEKLIALLVDHYIKPDPSLNMHEFLFPLDCKCPEFISLFITLAHRTQSTINESLAIVYGTFMQNNLSYLLSQFRDETWMAEEFAKEVFPKCLSYVLSIDPSQDSGLQHNHYKTNGMYALCAGLLPIIQGWQKKVKDIELDAEPLFDNSYPWTIHRSDLLVIYGKISKDNYAKVIKFIENCYPPHSDQMLSRLVVGTLRRSAVLSRNIHVSVATLGGGGSHDPVPTNIPKPGPTERNLFGEGKTSRVSEDSPYVPTSSDYSSYIGAAIGVLLTFLAVAYKTDVFKSSKDDHGHHAKKTPTTKPARILGPGESPHEASASPLKPSPVITAAQPEAAQMEPQPSSERQATQQAPRDKRNEGEQTKLTHTQEPPAEDTPMTPNPETSEEKTTKDSSSSSNNKEESKDTKKGANADEIPEYVEYLLVGAGAASYYAALAIRARDADAKVLMIGDEKHLPYNRPPLSKELWWYGDENSGQTLKYKAISGKIRDIFLESQGFFVPIGELSLAKHGGVSILKEKRVARICPSEKKAFLEDGTEIRFGKCLLATGGRPKEVQELKSLPLTIQDKVVNFHGVDDYRKLDKICSELNSITIIGGSFVASELAYGIKRKYPKIEVTQIMKEKGNIAKVLPEFLAVKLADSLRKYGVNVLTETQVSGARETASGIEIKLDSSTAKKIKTDFIVVATGNDPETAMIEASGLEVDNTFGGVLADAELRVSPGIYCAGDVCSFFDRTLGRRRVEHWEHAQITGRLAGENMTGGEKAFWFQSSFFTKFSPDYYISAVGNVDASLETISVFAKDESDDKHERGVVFYKNKANKVVGVLMINVFGPSLDVGRRLIEDSRTIEDFRELSKLFPLFEQPKEEDGITTEGVQE